MNDYEVRVWTGTVSVHRYGVLEYAGGNGMTGIQTNTDDERMNRVIRLKCDEIAKSFAELDELLRGIDQRKDTTCSEVGR